MLSPKRKKELIDIAEGTHGVADDAGELEKKGPRTLEEYKFFYMFAAFDMVVATERHARSLLKTLDDALEAGAWGRGEVLEYARRMIRKHMRMRAENVFLAQKSRYAAVRQCVLREEVRESGVRPPPDDGDAWRERAESREGYEEEE